MLGRDGVAAAVGCGPGQGAGLGLGEMPAWGLFGLVVLSAERGEVAGARAAAVVPGDGVVEVAAGGGAAAAGEGAGLVPGPDEVGEPVRRSVAGYLAERGCRSGFEPGEVLPGEPGAAGGGPAGGPGPARAQAWAAAVPSGRVKVMHQRVLVPAAARRAARSRLVQASRGPRPAASPGRSARPSQVLAGRVMCTDPPSAAKLPWPGRVSWPGSARRSGRARPVRCRRDRPGLPPWIALRTGRVAGLVAVRPGRGGEEGVGVAAGEQGGEHGGAELVQAAAGAGVVQGAGDGGDPPVRGDRVGGVELPAGQGQVAGAFLPGFDPGVVAGAWSSGGGPRPGRSGGPGCAGRGGAARWSATRRCGSSAAAAALAARSARAASSAANTVARARSICPASSARSTAGSRARSRARPSRLSADRPVSTSAAASSAATCSLTRDQPGRPRLLEAAVVQFGDGGELDPGLPRRQPPRRAQQPDQRVVAQSGRGRRRGRGRTGRPASRTVPAAQAARPR